MADFVWEDVIHMSPAAMSLSSQETDWDQYQLPLLLKACAR